MIKQRLSTIWRFLLPIIILLVIAPIIFLDYLSTQQLKLIESNARDRAKSLVSLLRSADTFTQKHMDAVMADLKMQHQMEPLPDNPPRLALAADTERDLDLKYGLIAFSDALPNTLSADIVQRLKQNKSVYGVQKISGELYKTRYDPIANDKNQVIGTYYVLGRVDGNILKHVLDSKNLLKSAVILIQDKNENVLLHTDNIQPNQAIGTFKNRLNNWVVIQEKLENGLLQVQIAYPVADARQIGFKNLTFLIVASTLLGVALIAAILVQLQRLILKPIGADPSVAIQVVQKIAEGDLSKDNLTAEPDTLMANVLTMRSKLSSYIHLLNDNAERLSLSASVFDHAHDGIFITDASLKILNVNPAFTKITGYPKEAVLDHTPSELGFAFHDSHYFQTLMQQDVPHKKWRGEVWNLHSDGNVYAAWLDIFEVSDEDEVVKHYVGLFSDITDAKTQQKNLEHMAYHDPLTQLPNRTLFSERLNHELASIDVEKELLAICYFDLDGFKPVNDALGHEAGDQLLVTLATRVRACLRNNDTIARLGGDEFAILLSGLKNKEECKKTLDRLLEVINLPYDIANQTVNVSASIGYTIYPLDASQPDTLLRHADHAMYHVKVNGRGFHHQFDAEQDRKTRTFVEEKEAITKALPNGEFRLHYQPKVHLSQGKVIGVEALIRWQHPEKGLRSPADFLPILEQDNHAAIQMGEWVIGEALRQIGVWSQSGLDIKVSVNVSAKHMMQENFASRLAHLLSEHPQVSPALLEIEITETAAIEDIAGVAKTITDCKNLGVSFALDDFGVGYSSLTYLRRLPVEVIKVDQSFVRDMLHDADDMAVVSGVIRLGHSFGLDVVAEGVETAEHGVELLKLGCELAQGYGISKPMEADKVLGWVNAYHPDESWSHYSEALKLPA